MRRCLLLGLGATLALHVLIASSPAQAAPLPPQPTQPPQPKQLRLGTADKDPFVFTWVDGADGAVATDAKTAANVHDLFAKTVWVFLDDGSLIVAQGTSLDNLKAIVTLHQAHSSDLTFFLIHWRSKDGAQSMDGSVNVSSQDAKKAFVEMTFVDRQKDGSSFSNHIETALTSQ